MSEVAEVTPDVEPVAAPVDTAPVAADPFALDEAKLISLSPEQRASIEPIISEWKSKATKEIETARKTVEDKYKPLEEKATALDNLVKYPQFQQWWAGMQQAATQNMNQQQQRQAAQVQPQDVASPQEWQQALQNAYMGDSGALMQIQQRMMQSWAAPVVKDITDRQKYLETSMEMKELFEKNPEASDLDKVTMDGKAPNAKNPSVLEVCMRYVVDQNGGTLKQALEMAKGWANQFDMKAKQRAMGMVQEKKGETVSGPSSSQGGNAVVYVEDQDELIRKNMEALMSGQKPPQFVIRPQNSK